MKAPDKIYINNYNGNDTWGNQWHTKPSTNPLTVSHEYIRKDLVDETIELAEDHAYFAGKEKLREEFLEWIREREDEITKKMDGYNIPPKEYQGELNAYRNVIEKMKSL